LSNSQFYHKLAESGTQGLGYDEFNPVLSQSEHKHHKRFAQPTAEYVARWRVTRNDSFGSVIVWHWHRHWHSVEGIFLDHCISRINSLFGVYTAIRRHCVGPGVFNTTILAGIRIRSSGTTR
jgi:hypothetical protein